MIKFEDSKTKENLHAAFSKEAMARVKYMYYANAAKKQGYEQIAEIFEKTSNNENAHSKIWYNMIVDNNYATNFNLQQAIQGEHYEWTNMYEDFAKVADAEGFADIASKFRMVAAIEKEHENRFKTFLADLENNETFKKQTETIWECRNCGHLHTGTEAQSVCPVCNHPKAYFEVHTK